MQRGPVKIFLVIFLFLLFAGFVSYRYLLPRYVEKIVLPSLGKRFSTVVKGEVHRIRMHEAALGNLNVGTDNNRALHISSIRAGYSLSSVINGKIDLIEIDGLVLYLEILRNSVRISGLDPEIFSGDMSAKKPAPGDSSAVLPIQIGRFRISNSRINIGYRGEYIPVPLDLMITRKERPETDTAPLYQIDLKLSPRGEQILISGLADLAANRGSCTFSFDSLDLEKFEVLPAELKKDFDIKGISTRGKATFSLLPFAIESAEVELEAESFGFKQAQVSFIPSADNPKNLFPIRLKINGSDQKFQVSVQGMMAAPLKATLALEGTVKVNEKSLTGSGTISGRILDKILTYGPGNLPVSIRPPSVFRADFSFERTEAGTWQAALRNQGAGQLLEIVRGDYRVSLENPTGMLAAKGSADKVDLQLALQIENIRAAGSDNEELIVPGAGLEVQLQKESGENQPETITGRFSAASSDMAISKGDLAGRVDVVFSGIIPSQHFRTLDAIHTEGELFIKKATAGDKKNRIFLESIQGRIPWQWPASDFEKNGMLRISGLKWMKNELGSLRTDISLNGLISTFNGSFSHSLPEGMTTGISGWAGITDSGFQADIDLNMEPTYFSRLNLSRFDPALVGTYITGELGFKGNFGFSTAGLQGGITVNFNKGRLESKEKYTIDNIRTSLLLPSLPDLSSAPGQEIYFEKVSVNDLEFNNGRIVWQLESSGAIFVEEATINWADGRVHTNNVRVSPDQKDFALTIFCDRLLLTEILKQVGADYAEGEGRVSGRIPLVIGQKSIRIKEGQLSSKPGQGGRIRVSALDMLSRGIPKNSEQFAQVDFAAEAMKNFQYDWVRLFLNSEGEDLVVKMHIDGKPLHSLPFRYDSRSGHLQRDESGGPGIDQPIKLDLNFRFPLDRLLGYSGRIEEILNRLK